MNTGRCPACYSGDTHFLLTMNKEKLSRLNNYDLKYYGGKLGGILSSVNIYLNECRSCQHIWYGDMPSDSVLSDMYQSLAEHREKTGKAHKGTKNIPAYVKAHIDHLKAASNGNTLLDFGAGEGTLSRAASEAGLQVTAYEPYEVWHEGISDKITYISELASLSGKTFDVVLCNQVLEHVKEPDIEIERMKAHSHDKTIFSIAVPNVSRFYRSGMLNEWPYNGKTSHLLAPMQHLQGFNQQSLIALMKRHGLKPSLKTFQPNIKGAAKLAGYLTKGYIPKLSSTGFIFSHQ